MGFPRNVVVFVCCLLFPEEKVNNNDCLIICFLCFSNPSKIKTNKFRGKRPTFNCSLPTDYFHNFRASKGVSLRFVCHSERSKIAKRSVGFGDSKFLYLSSLPFHGGMSTTRLDFSHFESFKIRLSTNFMFWKILNRRISRLWIRERVGRAKSLQQLI